MLSDRNSGIILLIALILMFVRIPFVLFDGNYIAALMVLVVAIILIVKGK